jgi:glycosyltransferase involved in cell wall biosynthesis
MAELQTQRLVSIIIPTYNRAAFLKEMLGSLAAQTYRPIEVIVVDDGSIDHTPQMMMTAVQELHAVGISCLYTTQAKSNGCRARNRGFQLSKGQYVVFMDSDDYAHPEMITFMVGALELSNADFCVCDSERFCRFPRDTGDVKELSKRQHSAREHIRTISLQTWFLARRFVIDAIGPWEEELTHRQDVEYTFRILASGFKGVWIPEILYFWRKHNDQVSNRTDEKAIASSLLVLTKMAAFAKVHGQYNWSMRVILGQEFARLAYACNRLGYLALARQATRYANRECPGIHFPLHFYQLVRQLVEGKSAHRLKTLFRQIIRSLT